MSAPMRQPSASPARIVQTPGYIGGAPRIDGTRIPAMTIVWQIRHEEAEDEIFRNYPGLPIDGIVAVRRWAEDNGISLAPGAEDDPFAYDPAEDDDPLPDR